MVQTIQASELTLREVEQKFNLQENLDSRFFPEWQNNLPEVSRIPRGLYEDGREKIIFSQD